MHSAKELANVERTNLANCIWWHWIKLTIFVKKLWLLSVPKHLWCRRMIDNHLVFLLRWKSVHCSAQVLYALSVCIKCALWHCKRMLHLTLGSKVVNLMKLVKSI